MVAILKLRPKWSQFCSQSQIGRKYLVNMFEMVANIFMGSNWSQIFWISGQIGRNFLHRFELVANNSGGFKLVARISSYGSDWSQIFPWGQIGRKLLHRFELVANYSMGSNWSQTFAWVRIGRKWFGWIQISRKKNHHMVRIDRKYNYSMGSSWFHFVYAFELVANHLGGFKFRT